MKIKALIIIFTVFALMLSCVSANETVSDAYNETNSVDITSTQNISSSTLYTIQTNSTNSTNSDFNNSTLVDSYNEILPANSEKQIDTKKSKHFWDDPAYIHLCNVALRNASLELIVENNRYFIKCLLPENTHDFEAQRINDLEEKGYSPEFIQSYFFGRNALEKTNQREITKSFFAQLVSDNPGSSLYSFLFKNNNTTSKQKKEMFECPPSLITSLILFLVHQNAAEIMSNNMASNWQRKIDSLNEYLQDIKDAHSAQLNSLLTLNSNYEYLQRIHDCIDVEDAAAGKKWLKSYELMTIREEQGIQEVESEVNAVIKDIEADESVYKLAQLIVKYRHEPSRVLDPEQKWMREIFMAKLDERLEEKKLKLLTEMNTHDKFAKGMERNGGSVESSIGTCAFFLALAENLEVIVATIQSSIIISVGGVSYYKALDKYMDYSYVNDYEMEGYFKYIQSKSIAALNDS